MAVALATTVTHYTGLSSDTKPTAAAGSRYFETDTGRSFVSNGSTWSETTIPVVGKCVVVDASFVRPANTTAYTAGDVVSNSASPSSVITFSNCARFNGGSGVIIGATMVDSASQATKGQFELWLFQETFVNDADNAAFNPNEELEMVNAVGVIEFATSFVGVATAGAGGNCLYQGERGSSNALNMPFVCGSASKNLYGTVVVRNAYTPVSAEKFTFRLYIAQN
jgi:hypothetical protein